jgi:uncharacterized protein (UPF0332 family)
LTTEAERFLRKARESLASAKADVRAKRYNSAANRAYYACFQAAVAALIENGVRPSHDWEHRFVASEFSGKLIKRRKLFASEFSSTLSELFDTRVTADYEAEAISAKHALRAMDRAERLVGATEGKMTTKRIGETKTEYGPRSKLPKLSRAKDYVELLKREILISYPDVEFEVRRRTPTQFTLIAYTDLDDPFDLEDVIEPLRGDILTERGVWIVLTPRRRHLEDD